MLQTSEVFHNFILDTIVVVKPLYFKKKCMQSVLRSPKVYDCNVLYSHFTVVFLDTSDDKMEVNIATSWSLLMFWDDLFEWNVKSLGIGYFLWTISPLQVQHFFILKPEKEQLLGYFLQTALVNMVKIQ